jgi:hypothetical protein
MSNVHEVVRLTILRQLSHGASCRIHLHRECCTALGLSIEPKINEKNQRTRICKDLPDNQFDTPFNDLLSENLIQKINTGSLYAFYELTDKGKKLLTDSS